MQLKEILSQKVLKDKEGWDITCSLVECMPGKHNSTSSLQLSSGLSRSSKTSMKQDPCYRKVLRVGEAI